MFPSVSALPYHVADKGHPGSPSYDSSLREEEPITMTDGNGTDLGPCISVHATPASVPDRCAGGRDRVSR